VHRLLQERFRRGMILLSLARYSTALQTSSYDRVWDMLDNTHSRNSGRNMIGRLISPVNVFRFRK
jgi:hypothetical protein